MKMKEAPSRFPVPISRFQSARAFFKFWLTRGLDEFESELFMLFMGIQVLDKYVRESNLQLDS